MGRGIALVMLVCLLGGSGLAWAAADLEEGVKELADKITKSMVEKGTHKIAIVDFSDLNGAVTALGQFLAEELTTQLFQLAPGKFEVVERRQLLRLEEELVLGQLGVLDEKTLKQMGKVLGVEAIVTGSMADLGNMIKVNARMIAVETAKVFAVAATSIPKTGLVADLASKLVERKAASPAPAGTGGAAPTSKGAKVPTVKPVEVADFRFDLQRCAKQSSKIVCTFLVTNLKEDRLLTLHASYLYKPSV
jgi:TolB-like protein